MSPACRSEPASTGTTTRQPSSTSAATTERPRPPAPPVTSAVRSGIAAQTIRPARLLGFLPVRVCDLTPGQDIDQVLMVRTSDGRRLVLGDRTGTLEAHAVGCGGGRVRVGARARGAARARGCLRAARGRRGRVRARRPDRRAADPGRAHGGRSAGADRDRPVRAPAGAAGLRVRGRDGDLGGVPRGPGGQALPPGLPARAARALADGRAVGVGDQRDVRRRGPRRGGDRRAAARHRQARRLHDAARWRSR